MADGEGISHGELSSAISALRSELRAEFYAGLRDLQAELHSEIRRIEEEMRQIGEMIVAAIRTQTVEVAAGLAATTAMVESTRRQIEDDFSKTRESTLQIEVGKKVAEARSVRDKMSAFISDIKSRFDRALITSAQNRELYNVAFRNLTDEYGAKIRSIGAHIFQVRVDDIAPAMRAAAVPLEEAHGLPIEMDLERLKRRADQLDRVLELLKASRLDDVVSSLDKLEQQVNANAVPGAPERLDDDYCVEAIATRSELATRVCAGLSARPVSGGLNVDLGAPSGGMAPFSSGRAVAEVAERFEALLKRPPTPPETERLAAAARALRERNLISDDALALVQDFLGADSLRWVGG